MTPAGVRRRRFIRIISQHHSRARTCARGRVEQPPTPGKMLMMNLRICSTLSRAVEAEVQWEVSCVAECRGFRPWLVFPPSGGFRSCTTFLSHRQLLTLAVASNLLAADGALLGKARAEDDGDGED